MTTSKTILTTLKWSLLTYKQDKTNCSVDNLQNNL